MPLLSQLRKNWSSVWGRGWLQFKQSYKHPWAEVDCRMKRVLGSCQQNRHLRHREREKERGDHLQVLRIWKQEALTGSSVDPLTSPPVLSGKKPLGAKGWPCSTRARGPGRGESQLEAPTEPRMAESGSAHPIPPDPGPRAHPPNASSANSYNATRDV